MELDDYRPGSTSPAIHDPDLDVGSEIVCMNWFLLCLTWLLPQHNTSSNFPALGSSTMGYIGCTTGTTNLVKAEEDRKHPGLANLSHLNDDNIILLGEIYLNVKINNLHIALEFISALQWASLDDPSNGLDSQAVYCLQNPPTEPPFVKDPNLQAIIKLYLGLQNADWDYEMSWKICMELMESSQFPILYQVKEAITILLGVKAVIFDICINSCVGFAGPFLDSQHCPECGEILIYFESYRTWSNLLTSSSWQSCLVPNFRQHSMIPQRPRRCDIILSTHKKSLKNSLWLLSINKTNIMTFLMVETI